MTESCAHAIDIPYQRSWLTGVPEPAILGSMRELVSVFMLTGLELSHVAKNVV